MRTDDVLSLCFHFTFKWNSKFEILQNQMLFKFMIIKMIFPQQAQNLGITTQKEINWTWLLKPRHRQNQGEQTGRITMPEITGVWWGGRNMVCAGWGGFRCVVQGESQKASLQQFSHFPSPTALPSRQLTIIFLGVNVVCSSPSGLEATAWSSACPREILDLHSDWDCQKIPKQVQAL